MGKKYKYKVCFQTLGCKVNSYETDAVKQEFIRQGFEVVDKIDQSDVYVINTCTVTAEADRKSRQMIRRGKKDTRCIVIAMGCQTQLNSQVPEADIQIGTENRLEIVSRAKQILAEREKEDLLNLTTEIDPFSSIPTDNKNISSLTDLEMFGAEETVENFYENLGVVTSQADSRAYIKIEDGCNNFCSYCIIPYARGRVRSRKMEDVILEAEALAAKNFKEIVLTGIHICSYGLDFPAMTATELEELNPYLETNTLSNTVSNSVPLLAPTNTFLLKLLVDLNKINGIKRIRLGSLEPNSISTSFVQGISKIEKLCPHFHLSLQSGSDSVLKRMNRKYSCFEYENVVNTIRQAFVHPSFTTDIIVGFPGETTIEHEESLAFCQKIKMSKIHVFPFSPRKNTPAYTMKPQVSKELLKQRKNQFLALGERLSLEQGACFINREVEILVEKQNESLWGYSKEYFYSEVSYPAEMKHNNLVGKIIVAQVEKQADEHLICSFLREQ